MSQQLEWLRGCGTALVTPFNAAGEVHEARFRTLVERQIAAGVRLLVPCGTTGEAATLTPAEQERVIALTVETALPALNAHFGVLKKVFQVRTGHQAAYPPTSPLWPLFCP